MSELHPEIRRVLEARAETGRKGVSSLTVTEARAQKRELLSLPEDPAPAVTTTDLSLPGPASDLPARLYEPDGTGPFPVLVYFHGGGWVRGTLDNTDLLCRNLAEQGQCIVVSVDYRLAPEHPFPAAVDDCYAATAWVADGLPLQTADTDRLAVGGDSAGGNLATVVARLADQRGGPDIAYQMLIYPVTNYAFDTPSYEENATGYLLSREGMKWYWNHYVEDGQQATNPNASPLLADDLSGVPPATVLTAGFDPLRDEGIAYAERLRDAGVTVTHRHYDDAVHGFVVKLYDPDLTRAREAVDALASDLRTHLS